MEPNAKISVIIPTLNEEKLVERAIWSAVGADEVIVVDGGSNDQSVSLAKQTRATVIESRQGRGVQLRTGAEAATGDILLLLHADSWLHELAIPQLRAKYQATAATGAFHGCFRQRIEDSRFRYRLLERGNAIRATWFRTPYGDQAQFVDRKTYDAVGGIDDVPLMEDVLFSRKLRRISRPALLDGPVNLSARRWNRRGVIRQTIKNWSILSAFCLGVSPVKLARWYR